MKSLVIAEKPSVGRDIARVLSCGQNHDGVLEGSRYVVTWALGHLVTLADPEQYDKKYEEWKLDTLPMLPEKMELVVIGQTARQYKIVKSQLVRKDIDTIIIATDAGREGELVARWILEKAGCKKPVKRLWISSVTDKAIREGFASLKDGREYLPLYAAAQARAEADWLVGMNGTRALTCKYNAQLSCGRVQTPTLAILAAREDEIRNFVPKDYYGAAVTADGIRFVWQEAKTKSFRTFSEEEARAAAAAAKRGPFILERVEKKAKQSFAPGLYDLTTLQREANQKYGYSAKMTLDIMQRLYENHKVLTYPRTDSRYIGTDVAATLRERVRACGGGPYRAFAAEVLKKPITGNKSFADDTKVSDHHAIIPTEQYADMMHMTADERRIYDMVVRRFFSVLYPPCEYEQVTFEAVSGGAHFLANGIVVKNPGYRAVLDPGMESEDTEDEEQPVKAQTLPDKKQGECLTVAKAELTRGKTKPPAYFTEATLLAAMENPVRYMETRNAALAKMLGETGGLGTVATRADIIEKLFHTFLMEKKGNEIHLTAKAKQLLKLVPEDLRKPELTARWEQRLTDIAKGREKKEKFLLEIRDYTTELVSEIKSGEQTYRHENMTTKKCPVCGKYLLAVNGKNSKMLVCQDRECGYRETLSRTTNARCPQCHKRMELMKKGEQQTFVCVCGYKERLEAFEQRRKKEGGGVSKRDVQKYLQKQQKETQEPVNSAFADALAKLSLHQ